MQKKNSCVSFLETLIMEYIFFLNILKTMGCCACNKKYLSLIFWHWNVLFKYSCLARWFCFYIKIKEDWDTLYSFGGADRTCSKLFQADWTKQQHFRWGKGGTKTSSDFLKVTQESVAGQGWVPKVSAHLSTGKSNETRVCTKFGTAF